MFILLCYIIVFISHFTCRHCISIIKETDLVNLYDSSSSVFLPRKTPSVVKKHQHDNGFLFLSLNRLVLA